MVLVDEFKFPIFSSGPKLLKTSAYEVFLLEIAPCVLVTQNSFGKVA